MAACLMLSTTIILLVLSAVSGDRNIVWYQPVAGDCSNLTEVKDDTNLQVSSGKWYLQYTSAGEAGTRCATSHAMQSGNETHVDYFMLGPNTHHYVQVPVDLTYHEDKDGMYIDDMGANGHVLTTDFKNNHYYTQCKKIDGATKVFSMFATREPVLSKADKKVYEEYSAKLAARNLLPPMRQVDHTDCPPLRKIVKGRKGRVEAVLAILRRLIQKH